MRFGPGDFRFKVYNRTDTVGNGTYSNYLLEGAQIRVTRTLNEGSKFTIISKRKTMDPQIDRVRPIRFYWKDPCATPANWIKIFDGCLKEPGYENISNKLRSLQTSAYGWERELASITLELDNTGGATYEEMTIEDIITDLTEVANSFGMVKQARFVYDPSRIPDYSTVEAALKTVVTRTYTGSVWSALLDLTEILDTATTGVTGEWTIKIDSLQSDDYIYIIPMMTAIDTVVFGSYLIGTGFTDGTVHPNGLVLWLEPTVDLQGAWLSANITYTNQDGTTGRFTQCTIPGTAKAGDLFQVKLMSGDLLVKDVNSVWHAGGTGGINPDRFAIIGKYTRVIQDAKLNPPKQIQRDYTRLLNYAVVRGKGILYNKQYGDTPVLDELTIPTNAEHRYNPTDPNFVYGPGNTPPEARDPKATNYLLVTLTNVFSTRKGGRIEINGFSNMDFPVEGQNTLSEYRWVDVPPNNGIRRFYTVNRYALLRNGDTEPDKAFILSSGFYGCKFKVESVLSGIAGGSINRFGIRAKSIRDVDMDTQEKVDAYARHLVETSHAPHLTIESEFKPEFVCRMDLIGKGLRMYDNFAGKDNDFLCTEQSYIFSGNQVRESFKAIKNNYDWDYCE